MKSLAFVLATSSFIAFSNSALAASQWKEIISCKDHAPHETPTYEGKLEVQEHWTQKGKLRARITRTYMPRGSASEVVNDSGWVEVTSRTDFNDGDPIYSYLNSEKHFSVALKQAWNKLGGFKTLRLSDAQYMGKKRGELSKLFPDKRNVCDTLAKPTDTDTSW